MRYAFAGYDVVKGVKGKGALRGSPTPNQKNSPVRDKREFFCDLIRLVKMGVSALTPLTSSPPACLVSWTCPYCRHTGPDRDIGVCPDAISSLSNPINLSLRCIKNKRRYGEGVHAIKDDARSDAPKWTRKKKQTHKQQTRKQQKRQDTGRTLSL